MDILIKSATIIDSKSKYHLKKRDVLIKNGKIEKIADKIEQGSAKVIKAKDLYVSKGWIDLQVNYQDPGFEYKEDIQTGLNASAAGGFTAVGVSPATSPTRDVKAQVEYLVNQSKAHVIDALPYGAVSKNMEGKELAELSDMQFSGALAFSDGKQSIKNPNLLNRALLYSKAFDGTVMNYPNTKDIAELGVMNEGEVSTGLGLKGIPELAEELMVSRDIFLVEYTDGRLHFNTISTAKSIELIANAKAKNLKVSCDIASYSLLLTDSELKEFDTRFKTLPPLRTSKTIKKLISGIKNGTIDAICSDHCPEDIESKKKEFDYAAFGIINAQTAFSVANTALLNSIPLEQLISLFTDGPAKVLGLERPTISEGESANLTLFQPNEKFIFNKDDVLSKSDNSPFFGRELTGKVLGLINGKKQRFN
ncbi:MAG: dihydroorotase [Vicingaceae bacterium]